MSNLDKLKGPYSLRSEVWREYDLPGREQPYRIYNPQDLYFQEEGITHRVVDGEGIVHLLLAPTQRGVVLRWKNREGERAVNF